MSTPPAPMGPIQAAYYGRLTGDEDLKALITGVFDHVPEGQAYDYVVIGEATEIPNNEHGRLGRETTQTIHVWSKHRGYSRGLAIASRITALLDHQPLIIAGLHHVSTKFEFQQTLTDPKPPGDLRHIPMRFRTVTEQES
ncbi:DUF3168 domain-containing protein [Spirillospora sp. NBC_00431]